MKITVDRGRINFLKRVLLYFVILFPLCPVNGLYKISWISSIYSAGAIIEIVVIIFLLGIRKFRASNSTIIFFAFSVWLAMTSFINGSSFSTYELFLTARIIAFLYVSDYLIAQDSKCYLLTISFPMLIAVCFNINDVLSTESIIAGIDLYTKTNQEYFLASDNFMGYYFVPLMTVIILYSVLKFGKVTFISWFAAIIPVINMVLVWSGTGVFGCFLFLALLIVCLVATHVSGLRCPFTVNRLIWIYIAVFVILVVLQGTDVFSFITVGILHKTSTLTGRTDRWAAALQEIFNSPYTALFGHGGSSGGRYIISSVNDAAHNLMLDITLQSGLIGVGLFIATFLSGLKKLRYHQDSLIGQIVLIGIFAQFVMYLSEGNFLTNTYQYCLLPMIGIVTNNCQVDNQ
ncbi:MAG: hypothetical protein LUH23_03950 [Oscillospiraceae bacterium]|nr:hypothetical protein [Oscillospiraceae bacterium]